MKLTAIAAIIAASAGIAGCCSLCKCDCKAEKKYFKDDPAVSFVYQHEQKGLGHAVLQAAPAFAGETGNVLVLLGDALVAGGNASKELMETSARNGGAAVIGLERVPRERVSRYGIVDMGSDGRIFGMVEKPSPEEAPSDLAVAGRYLLDVSVFDFLADQQAGLGGEIQLTDAIARMLGGKALFGCVYSGKRQDIGNPQGYFRALEAFNENR